MASGPRHATVPPPADGDGDGAIAGSGAFECEPAQQQRELEAAERRAAQQAAAAALAAEQRRISATGDVQQLLALDARVRELQEQQRAAERAERDAPGDVEMAAPNETTAFEAGSWNS